MKQRFISFITAVSLLISFVVIIPITANAAGEDKTYVFETASATEYTNDSAIQSATSPFGSDWNVRVTGGSSGARVVSDSGKTTRTGTNIWGSLKAASNQTAYLMLQPYKTSEEIENKIIYYNLDTCRAGEQIKISTDKYTEDFSGYTLPSSMLDAKNDFSMTDSKGEMNIVIDNASNKVYYYYEGALKKTAETTSAQASLAFQAGSNRFYFNNISYGNITPEITGSATIAAGSSRTYAITEAGEVSIPHPDFKLGLAEEVAGVTLSNNSVTVADTVATGTKITLNVSMGDGTGVIATKEITVTNDVVENTAYSLIATETETNKNNEAFRGKEIDFNITDNIKLHFGNSTTGTAMSASNGVDLRNDGGYQTVEKAQKCLGFFVLMWYNITG